MDHDDNDFQSQNLHLAGESSNKYPPVLQPYALPKFDFDDNLNGHLRFDNLVETEVFLGIEGHEDSRWIEDFSRGSSSVVFSSSVAESCAILRHNNVWSEATSSESVEMLLKSVGQDDVIARESTNKESDTCDELGCIIEHMEPSQKHEMSDNNSKVEAVDIPPTLSVDKTSGNSDGFKEDGEELHLPKNASQADDCELSGEGKSIILSTAAENSDITFNLQKESRDAEQNPVDQSGIDTEVTDSLIKGEEKDNSESRVQVDAKDHSVYDSTFGRSELNDQNALQLKDDTNYGLENRNYTSSKEEVLVDNSKIDGKSEAVEAHFDIPVCLKSKAESMEAETLGHTGEHDTKLKGTSDLLVTEGCGQDLINLAKASGQNASESSTDPEPAGQDIQVSHTHASYTVESVVEQVEQVAYGGRTAIDETESRDQHEMDGSEHGATILSLEEHKTSEGQTDPSLVCSSELLEPCAIKSSETCAAKHTAIESTKICSDDVLAVPNETNVGSPQVSAGPEQIIEPAFDRNAMDQSTDDSLAAGIGIVSQSVGTGSGGTAGELEEQKSQSDAIVVDNSGIDIDQHGLQTTPDLAEEVKHLEKEEADADVRSSSEDLLVTKTSSNATAEQSHVSESEKAGQTLACGQLLSEKAGTTLVVIDSFNSDSQSGQQLAKLSNCSTHTCEISPAVIVHEPKEIEAGNTEGRAVSENPEEAISKGDHEAELHGESESEPIQNKDSPQFEVGAASFGNLGNVSGTGNNGQLESNSASSLNDIKAQVVMPSMKCDALDIEMGGSSGASTASESTIKSHVPESGNISTGLESPSPTQTTIAKTSDLPVGEANNKIVKIHEVTNISPSTLDDSQGVKGNNVTIGERSLCFDANPFSGFSVNKDGENLQHVASVQVSIGSPIVGSPLTPSLEKTDSNTAKGIPERKSRRTSRAAGKETSKKGKSAKETTASRQIHSGSKTRIVTQTSPLAGQIVQSIQTANIRPLATFSTSVSSIPDLNSSTLSAVFQRPFTDLQQVQLRAQIFVYGALIQGTPPDEAYMVSAFGGPDGGKSSWENAWRVCMERAQKSHIASPETPMHLRSGVRAPDQTMKNTLQGKIISPLVGQTSGKDASAVNPVMSLSSPLWGMSTPRDTLRSSSAPKGAVSDHRSASSSLHLLQTPSIKNHVGHNTPWLLPSPYAGSYAGPWVASSQTNAFDTGARFSGFPTVEAVRLTPEKEPLLPPSGANHLSKDHIIQSSTSSSVPKGTPGFDPKNVIVSPGQHTSATKPRKRKKLPVSTEAVQITLHSQPQTLPFSAPVITSFALTSASITSPVNLISKSAQEKSVSCLSPHVLTGHGVQGNRETEQRSALSEETLSKLKVARMHAEDASALAAAALRDSEYVWKQMEQKSDSGLEPEIQRKLASATVAIAAAAAVAKAASAAANVASNAALQAKLMAEEVFDSGRGNVTYFSEGNQSLGQATPSSILKGDGASVSSNSFLFAARETARKRVEVATAATKRAENIDAIVKAAELAAEAVSQAGKLVTMGDPLSLNELIEANPDNCWKPAQSVVESEPCRGGSFDNKEAQVNSRGTSAGPRDVSTALDDHGRLVDSLSGSVSASIKRIKGDKDYKGIIHSPKTVAVVSEPEAALNSLIDSQTESEQITEASKEKIFEEGSNVEVFKEGLGWRKAWYSADILSLRKGEAYVSYTELSSEKGAGKLKEWVAFKDESGTPKIRIARPITAIPFEGTRKRRRAAIGDYNWSVGDKVDAWVHDSWWEGIVTEKNKKDETTLTVHFPAQGETLTVKAWHLRPSLFWKDGKWIEYAGVGGSNSSHEGDTPNEKRARFVSPAREAKKEEKSSKNVELPDSQKSQQPLLQLTASDKAFSIGKTTKEDNNLDPPRMKRTGLQKQGSRVIFGVPKPSKKRKYMEVSKHYVTGSSDKTSEPGDSVKFTKYLMPQASASRAWGRNIPKSDPKEKQAAVSKPKVFKPAVSKPKEKRSALATMVPQKQESLNADVDSGGARDQTNKVSVSNSSAGEASEGQTSSHDVSLGGVSKRTFSVSSEAEHANKGKAAHTAGRLAKIEENRVLGVNEPRRSNRRIQPTSRLLEGLQTSMIASKIPSVSHGKGHPNQNKNGSRGK